ncbi:MAG: HYC_CC_PP family protein [Sphingobacteriales bacterium]
MKKFLVTILAVLYITTSSGAVVHLHYCMDKLIGWGLWNNKEKGDQCGKCGMSKTGKKKSSCKDENKVVKIEKDQNAAESVYRLIPVYPVEHVSFFTGISLINISALLENNPVCNAPPRSLQVTTYLFDCNFRI